jgi:hypothetical protein
MASQSKPGSITRSPPRLMVAVGRTFGVTNQFNGETTHLLIYLKALPTITSVPTEPLPTAAVFWLVRQTPILLLLP